MKLKELSYLVYGLRRSTFALLAAVCLLPEASANCSWTPASGAVFTQFQIQFSDISKWLRKALWVDEERYPPGTLLALSTVSLRPGECTGLSDLRNRFVDFVYVPPPEAVRSENGYRIPAQAAGVALKLEFPGARGTHPYGLLISTSSIAVSPGGRLPSTELPWLNMRVKVEKTGPFAPDRPGGRAPSVVWPNGLGSIRYHVSNLPESYSASFVSLAMGPLAVAGSGIPGTAVGAFCQFGQPAMANAGHRGRALQPGSVISLAAVSSSDFTGFGPIGKGARDTPLSFHCTARAATQVKVSFDASFPFNGGLDGVGLPRADSDIGVQVLHAGSPVRFGIDSAKLPWVFTSSSPFPEELADRRVQGRFCIAACGENTGVNNPSWIEGDGGTGNNATMQTPITFRYFQTTQRRPLPQAFSVPFTVTLDWH